WAARPATFPCALARGARLCWGGGKSSRTPGGLARTPAADRVQVASPVQAAAKLRIVDLPACLLFQNGEIGPDQLHHRPGGPACVPVGDGDGQLTLEQRHLHASVVRPCEFDVVLGGGAL